MENKIDNIELRSDEVQDVLGATPSWLVRAGTTVIFAVIVILLVGCWFFKYPDVISAQVVITTENPPAQLRAMSTGKVTDIMAKEGDKINSGDLIAVIENTSNFNDVLTLKKIISTTPDLLKIPLDEFNYQLGDIQTNYSTLLRLLREYDSYNKLDVYGQKIKNLQIDKRSLEKFYNQKHKQLSVKREELQIIKNQLNRDSVLYKQTVLSGLEYEKSKQLSLQGELEFENLRASLIQTKMQIDQTESQINEISLQDKQDRANMKIGINQAKQELESQILRWERTYLIQSPISGKVTFTQVWSKNQNVQQGKIVATVVPVEEQKLIGKIFIPATGMGKVKEGQLVNIKLNNYPYMEFGLLKATVKKVSLVPTTMEEGKVIYTADVYIPEGMKSNYGKELTFSQEMTGVAEIITNDIRLLQRFFNPIKAIFKQNHYCPVKNY